MKFKPYPKIQGLHKPECDGILNGTCVIQEKIDGANASIWLDDDGSIHCGSRSRDLVLAGDSFNGFVDYVKTHPGINNCLKDNPTYRLYGEWLVRHTIGYSELAYKHFYLYEIENQDGEMLDLNAVYQIGDFYDIKTAHLFGTLENPTLEEIQNFAGQSVLGEKGEGVVIKNKSFINQFGNKQHGKYVTQEFKEDNAITFGGNNKSSETYNEIYYVNKFMTLPRIMKVIHKIEAMDGKPEMKHIPKAMGLAFYDLITEEGWTIASEMSKHSQPFNFKAFKIACDKKAKQIFIEIINNDISIAHYEQNNNDERSSS